MSHSIAPPNQTSHRTADRRLVGALATVAMIATVMPALVAGAGSIALVLIVGGLGLLGGAIAETRRPYHVFAEDLDREVIVLRT